MIKDIFTHDTANEVIDRINHLTPDQKPGWGKMSADQMLAHCNVAYAFLFEPEKFKKPGILKKFVLMNFVKNFVVGEKPFKINSPTGSDFLIKNSRDFEKEKSLLIENIQKVQRLGREHFEGKDNFSFGKMSANEWNILFYKHLDHHLRQFGV
ncbi:MAG TPA: DUF1569 domain-containing protein [Hanamia sp.]|nr:DUF1569 domain-containing protein [Hanamia sp.]